MKRNLVSLLLLFLILVVVFESSGQMNRRAIKRNNKRISSFTGQRTSFTKRYNFIGLSVNSMNYFGDLAPLSKRLSTDISFTKPAFGFSIARRFGPRYTLQAQFLYGTLSGSDTDSADPSKSKDRPRYLRNLSFRNHVKEISVVAYYDLFENLFTYSKRPVWAPYAYLGVALILHNPKAQAPKTDLAGNVLPEAGDWISLRSLGTEGQYSKLDPADANYGIKPYSLLVVAIPFGVGSRFKLTELLDLWVEIGARYTFTDYLDDVSKSYVDLGTLNSPLAKAMSYRTSELGPLSDPLTYQGRDELYYTVQDGYGHERQDNIRGNKSANDMYMVTSLRLTCIIPHSFQRPKHR
ncbi:MAG: DUF6089 family protein [Chryseolinea sp.]